VDVCLVDSRDGSAVGAAIAKIQPEIVFHLASQTRRTPQIDLSDVQDSIDSDLGLLVRLLAACSNLKEPLKMFVRAGTLAEYGAARPPFDEANLAVPLNSYGASMLAATQYLQMLQDRLPFPAVTGRLALIYGEGQSQDFLIPSIIAKGRAGEEIDVQHPTDTRDLIYIEDLVEGLIALSESPQTSGEVLNIATGIAHSMKDTAELTIKLLGADTDLLRLGRSAGSSGMPDFRTSISKANRMLDWRAKTSLRRGLEMTIARELTKSA
jgi:nucleoside-diphosphate-sugar epimerase